jgi:hypothetical protein
MDIVLEILRYLKKLLSWILVYKLQDIDKIFTDMDIAFEIPRYLKKLRIWILF